MDEILLKLGDKSFKLKFGLGLFRILGRKWQLPGIDDVIQKIAVLDSVDKKLTFEQIDILEEILLSAIQYGGYDGDTKSLDIIDSFFANPNALEEFKNALVSSLPSNTAGDEDEGK
jgi:hypothetical protein